MNKTKDEIITKSNEKLQKSKDVVTENNELYSQKRKSVNSLQEKKLNLIAELEKIQNSIYAENSELVNLSRIMSNENQVIAELERTLKETIRERDIDNSADEFPDFYVAITEQLGVVQSEFEKFNLDLKEPEVFSREIEAVIEGKTIDHYSVTLRGIKGNYMALVREMASKKIDGRKLVPKDYTALSVLLDDFLRMDGIESRWS